MKIQDMAQPQDFPETMIAVIEIPQNSVVKYEFCEETGALAVSRIMQTPVVYPVNYGFFPGTLGNDGDALDCLVISSAPIMPGALIKVRPIGVLLQQDQSGGDEKIICVPVSKVDFAYKNVNSLADLPAMTKTKIEYFFQHYKDLEPESWSKVSGFEDADAAKVYIKAAVKKYQERKGFSQ
jgi:inorganic pyrophosphatase